MVLLGWLPGLLVGLILSLVAAAVLGVAVVSANVPFAGLLGPVVATVVALLSPLGAGLVPAALLVIGVSVLFYALGSASNAANLAATTISGTAPTPLPPNLAEMFWRGMCLGVNGGLNAGLLGLLAATVNPAFVVVGPLALLVSFLVALPGLSATFPMQVGLAWHSLAMPMSWIATGLGFALFVADMVVGAFTIFPTVRFDWTTATVESFGGTLASITGFAGGFNLGGFTFITAAGGPTTAFGAPGLTAHETGHTLNVAAFGSIWHLAGNAVEENVILPPGAGPRAWGELLAESHFPRIGFPHVRIWS